MGPESLAMDARMIEHCSALVFRIKALLAKYVLIPLIVLIAMPFAALYQLSLTLRCQKTKMHLRRHLREASTGAE